MADPGVVQQAGYADLESISQQMEEDNQHITPVQLVSFGYRDFPLATLDLSMAGSQLLSNLDEEDTREGSNWLKPCCGWKTSLWQIFLLSVGFNCVLVACVVLVVLLLALELLIDTKLLQFVNAFQFASIIHWTSLVILSLFFFETVFRIVVLGIWDYIENKVEVFDGAVIVLSLAPMVASTVANGPSSPWDAISLIITLRIWRVKRVIDAYVLQVKLEMDLELQQYEKTKALREEQLERLTQICQEQAFEIRQLRAHLAQQDLDLAAERQAAIKMHPGWATRNAAFQVLEGLGPGEADGEGPSTRENCPRAEPVVHDDMNNYISQYYSESGKGTHGARVITTTAIEVHLSDHGLLSGDPTSVSVTHSPRPDPSVRVTHSPRPDASAHVAHLPRPDPSAPVAHLPQPDPSVLAAHSARLDPSAVVQELLSSLSEDSCLAQKGLDPVNLKMPSPEMEHRINLYNKKNQENLNVLHTKPLIHLQPSLEEKCKLRKPPDPPVGRVPEA
ncbi:transmembrane protein 266 [Paramormyrops kingsleyae]|uniref:Transmembrane protein 266 n=1 Tax=Paramormyrops kingsleyae TaxID=1676925 RepID=A0A3B3S524_9TELE|nr:transmembrane protein 266 [Paramormyrops kingsleyae]XP_023666930.1 transmembrane protein 266 [Paramormyrops kingsleyae]